jgi:threonine/homoserine/homoserine lactone efflux protein
MLALVSPIAVYAFAMSITPGPNNIMLAASGLRFGFWRTLPLMLGINAGFISLLAVCGTGIGALVTAEPRVSLGLKLAGSAYLLWLAWKLWHAGKPGDGASRPLGFIGAALFQYVNPKAWVMAVSAMAAFPDRAPDYWMGVLAVVVVFGLVNLPCIACWALFGAGIRRWLDNPLVMTLVNRGMALLTAGCVVMILV